MKEAREPVELKAIGKRDADRVVYKATHVSKHQRDREAVWGFQPVSRNQKRGK